MVMRTMTRCSILTRDYVEQIDRYKEHQGKTIERKTTEKVCLQCGETFDAVRKDAMYCSKKCRELFGYYKRTGGKVTEKVCLECGTTFSVTRKNTMFCSTKCNSAFYGKQKRGE